MTLNKITYKGKITFDYFEVWLGTTRSVFDHADVDIEEVKAKGTCVSTQICPWCTRKYGLYAEVERTPESISDEINDYKGMDPKKLDRTCGVDGCINGAADYVDLLWEDFTVEEKK